MEVRHRNAVLAALAASAALAGAGAAAASGGSQARGAAIKTLLLKLGDRVAITGTPLTCLVQKNNGIINFACFDGSLAAPKPHSYALGIADRAADLGQVSASGQSAKILTVVQEPAIAGAAFSSPGRRAQRMSVAPTTALLVGATHVFCAVQTTQGIVNVTCGLSSLLDKLQFPNGSYTVSASAKFAVIGKVLPKSQGGFKTIAAKTQP